MYFLPAEIIRRLDSETIASGVSGSILMERAGYGAYKFLKNVTAPDAKRFLIFAGKGNNAGDAFVIARYLIEDGSQVKIVVLADCDVFQGDALLNLQKISKASKISPQITSLKNKNEINSFDWHGDVIIDGILGTGIHGEVKGLFRAAIQKINDLNAPVFSLDIPSGLNCDTGEACGVAVKAKWTAMFANPKLAVLTDNGAQHCGRVEVIDIGIPEEITEKYSNDSSALKGIQIPPFLKGDIGGFQSTCFVDDNRQFPILKEGRGDFSLTAHKNNFGHLLIIAGSTGLTGAAILSARAAISSGAGLVTLAIPQSLNPLVVPAIASCMTLPVKDDGKGIFIASAAEEIIKSLHKFDAVAIGPGIGTAEETAEFISKLIPEICRRPVRRNSQCGIQAYSRKKLVIDADALNIFSERKELIQNLGENVVLTPHPGEFERLSGIKPDKTDFSRISVAKDFTKDKKFTLLLKGFHTVITSNKSDDLWINLTGNPGMATAGSGDVLTGIIGAFLARGFSAEKAAVSGAFIHGLAGDIAVAELSENSVTAEEIINNLGKAFLNSPLKRGI